jgi:D-alanyl-D-alanine carboxypeptidase/D-alanyl-D-alanine-endopeptidase (penicillin-binding protein 4)
MDRGRRVGSVRRAALVTAAALAIAAGGCGSHSKSASLGHSRVSGHAAGTTRPAARAAPTPRGLLALRADFAHQMALAGPDSGAFVYDIGASRVLFALRPNIRRAPASVEKVYTSVAALEELGADARLDTALRGAGTLGRGGVWHGDVYLRGGGDPTFGSSAFDAVWDDGLVATSRALVERLVARGIHRVTGHLVADESLFDSLRGGPASAYQPDEDLGGELGALTFNHGAISSPRRPGKRHGGAAPLRASGPGVYAAIEVARSLRAAGVEVNPSTRTGRAPAGARTLVRLRSPPLWQLLGVMNPRSDDFFAELLVKQLGARLTGSGSLAAGARVMSAALARFAIHPRIVDGSGLSRADRTTPHEVVRLLAAVADSRLGGVLRRSLAIPGVRGTLATRMRGTPASQRCWAKTGSLAAVSNIAGYCRARGGHLIAFAFFMQGKRALGAHTLQDNMIITLARDDPPYT